ncbi:glycosyltransferase family 4 protein [Vannielia litorea]|uniref:Glycosyl transferases group 1 n=1 Tax=Vannielia litorea TaxID=1217970 RepID=A0A1N6GWS9_9RHOB|nr:glycosyltransferase family 4 protein [Vannielia litorea]SIO11815.1 Glycosyl transferases group 1 [Vannielia litorea]
MVEIANLTSARDMGQHRVNCIVILPPPVTGQTLVSRATSEAVVRAGRGRIWGVTNDRGLTGWRWTLAKHWRLLGALVRAGALSRGRQRCYFVPDAGKGLWLNLIEAPLMRLGFREVWLHHHVFSYVRRRDWKMALLLKILGTGVRHVVLGRPMSDGLAARYGAARFHVLGNAAFVAEAPPGRTRDRLRTIGFLGNITRDKGIGLFIDTLRALEAEGEAVKAVIAGPIADPALRAEIAAFVAEAPDRRRAPGAVGGAAKRAFFDEIDLLLFPSLYANEALPLTIYEALAAGVPVLATRRGCIPDQLEGTGWTFDEAGFVAAAEAQAAAWRADPARFAEASRTARALYSRRRAEDDRSLAALVAKVTAP